MLNPDEVADMVTHLIDTRASGDVQGAGEILLGLTTGHIGDALNVAILLAGALAYDLGSDPLLGFHHVEVSHLDTWGRLLPGSTLDLPGHVATFVQMVVAVANGERLMARDLFLSFVESNGQKALKLLVLALNEVVHGNDLCPTCGGLETSCAG